VAYTRRSVKTTIRFLCFSRRPRYIPGGYYKREPAPVAGDKGNGQRPLGRIDGWTTKTSARRRFLGHVDIYIRVEQPVDIRVLVLRGVDGFLFFCFATAREFRFRRNKKCTTTTTTTAAAEWGIFFFFYNSTAKRAY